MFCCWKAWNWGSEIDLSRRRDFMVGIQGNGIASRTLIASAVPREQDGESLLRGPQGIRHRPERIPRPRPL